MTVKVITPPTTEPLSLEEAKQHLRIDGSEDDSLILSLIKQAREWCEDYQGKKYITQTLELVLDLFPSDRQIEFRNCSPIQNVDSFKYTDKDGIVREFEGYIVDKDSFINRVVLNTSKYWPTTELMPVNGIRIQFIAGFGNASAVPESIKWAMVAHMKILADGVLISLKDGEKQKIESVRNSLLGMRRVIPV